MGSQVFFLLLAGTRTEKGWEPLLYVIKLRHKEKNAKKVPCIEIRLEKNKQQQKQLSFIFFPPPSFHPQFIYKRNF